MKRIALVLLSACSSKPATPREQVIAWSASWERERSCIQQGDDPATDVRDAIAHRRARGEGLPDCNFSIDPPMKVDAGWEAVADAIAQLHEARKQATYFDDTGDHIRDSTGLAYAIRDVDDRMAVARASVGLPAIVRNTKRIPPATAVRTIEISKEYARWLSDTWHGTSVMDHVLSTSSYKLFASAIDRVAFSPYDHKAPTERDVGTWRVRADDAGVFVDDRNVFKGRVTLGGAIGTGAHRIIAFLDRTAHGTIVWLDSRDAGKTFATTSTADGAISPASDDAIDVLTGESSGRRWRHVTTDTDTTVTLPDSISLQCGTTTQWKRVGGNADMLAWTRGDQSGTVDPKVALFVIRGCAGDAALVVGDRGVARCTTKGCEPAVVPSEPVPFVDVTSDGWVAASGSSSVVDVVQFRRPGTKPSTSTFRIGEDETLIGVAAWSDQPTVLIVGPTHVRLVRLPDSPR